MKNKKIIAIMLSVSVMLTGCVQSYEVEEQKEVIEEEKKEITQEDIIKEFEPLFRLSEEEDFSYLYEEDYGFVDKLSQNNDVGVIRVLSSISRPWNESILFEEFTLVERVRIKTEERVAIFYLEDSLLETTEKHEVLMDYENGEYIIRDEESPSVIKETFDNEVLPYEYIILNEEYLQGLELEHWAYNPSLPSYILKYRLDENDINVQKIKEIYPDVNLENASISLHLTGSGAVGEVIYSQQYTLEINSDKIFRIDIILAGESESRTPEVFN